MDEAASSVLNRCSLLSLAAVCLTRLLRVSTSSSCNTREQGCEFVNFEVNDSFSMKICVSILSLEIDDDEHCVVFQFSSSCHEKKMKHCYVIVYLEFFCALGDKFT